MTIMDALREYIFKMDITFTNVTMSLCFFVLLFALFKKMFPDAKTRDKLKVEKIIEHLCDKVLKGGPSDWDDFENNAKIREKAIVNMALKNGNTFAMHCRGHVADALGTNRIIATCEPTLVKELFLNKVHTIKRPERYRLAQFLPGLDGVLFQDGERWKTHSRALIPVFHASNFNQYARFMNEAAVVHVTQTGWQKEVFTLIIMFVMQSFLMMHWLRKLL